jgi:hypothetical protein
MSTDSGKAHREAIDFDISPPRFSLGRVLGTPGALDLLNRAGANPLMLLARHQNGDWGDVPPEDSAANDIAILKGLRILSCYRISPVESLWIITEADRSATTLLLPGEY